MTQNDLLLLGVLALGILAVALAIAYVMLSEKQKQQDIEKRLGRLKKGFESSEELFITIDERSFFQILLDNFKARLNWLRNFNQNSSSKFRLQFEKCGWDPTFATAVIASLKIISFIMFMWGYYYLINNLEQMKGAGLLLQAALLLVFISFSMKFVDIIFDQLAKNRLKKIQKDFSLVIDLLVVCTEAGLPFDRSLERIAQEIIHQNPDLSRELTVVSAELSILPERRMAFENFAKRIPIDIIRSLCVGLIQAEEHGATIGKTLTVLSQEYMDKRMSDVETIIGKIGVKLTLPMVLCGLPILMILAIGPAVIAITNNFVAK